MKGLQALGAMDKGLVKPEDWVREEPGWAQSRVGVVGGGLFPTIGLAGPGEGAGQQVWVHLG